MAEEKPLYDKGVMRVRTNPQETGGYVLEIGDEKYFLESEDLHRLNNSSSLRDINGSGSSGLEAGLDSINPEILINAAQQGIGLIDIRDALLEAESTGVERLKLSIRGSQKLKKGDYGPFGQNPFIRDGPQPHPHKRY